MSSHQSELATIGPNIDDCSATQLPQNGLMLRTSRDTMPNQRCSKHWI